MKGIIIAAGMGRRMGQLTQNLPKCLVPMGDTTLLENIIHRFHTAGVKDIAIIVGYQADKIIYKIKDAHFYVNPHYEHNNILQSLMHAKDFIDDDILISYSDIWLEQPPVSQLAAHPSDCVLSVDTDWKALYEGRDQHPLSEAENVIYDAKKQALKLGKGLYAENKDKLCGEYIGLCKLSRAFCAVFKEVFQELPKEGWQQAYLTDFFNELIARKYPIHCSLHQGLWHEMDTEQDYERIRKTHEREKTTLC